MHHKSVNLEGYSYKFNHEIIKIENVIWLFSQMSINLKLFENILNRFKF